MSVLGAAPVSKRQRRLWSEVEKRRIVAETLAPGASVSVVARRHDVNANMLFTWRREIGGGAATATDDAMTFMPAVVDAAAADRCLAVSPGLAGRMEIAFAGGDRVIVDSTVDAAALARVVRVLSRR